MEAKRSYRVVMRELSVLRTGALKKRFLDSKLCADHMCEKLQRTASSSIAIKIPGAGIVSTGMLSLFDRMNAFRAASLVALSCSK